MRRNGLQPAFAGTSALLNLNANRFELICEIERNGHRADFPFDRLQIKLLSGELRVPELKN